MLRDMTAVKTRFLLMTVTVIPSWESWLARARAAGALGIRDSPAPSVCRGRQAQTKTRARPRPGAISHVGHGAGLRRSLPGNRAVRYGVHPPTAYPLQPPIIHR